MRVRYHGWLRFVGLTLDSGAVIPQNGTMARTVSPLDRVLLHVTRSRRVTVEPDDIYYLQAASGETIVRKRSKRTILDVRPLGKVIAAMPSSHIRRIHDKWAVNLRRVKEIRLQRDGRDWEVVMQPPVNRVLPVSRSRLSRLVAEFVG